VVTSAVGHLVEIKAYPEEYDVKRGKWSFAHLPVMPPHFDLRRSTRPRAAQRAGQAGQAQGRHRPVNACDAGREGELIFRLIVQYAWATSSKPSAACGCRA
jgi:DNA topoisomerase-3